MDGKNICKVNGRPVTVPRLHRRGEQLIQIHGQHDSQQLCDEENHVAYIDLFADNSTLLAEYRSIYTQILEIRQQIQKNQMDENEKARRIEMLQHQIQELENAELKIGEDEKLEQRRKVLHNAEKLISYINDALDCFSGNEEWNGVSSLLTQAERALGHAERYDSSLEGLHARITDLMYNAQDIAEDIRAMQDGFDDATEELERVEDRLDVLHRLRRKYGATCQDMLEFLANAKKELEEIVLSDEHLILLQEQLQKKETEAQQLALELRETRKQAAMVLSARILDELAQLDMPRVQFLCVFEESSSMMLGPNGIDAVRFLMSANVGETPKPMSNVASGGELARIMLAIKNVLAENGAVSTLIFDEVDAGVSGRAAQKVAEKLATVARDRQVLCVTHLPQIAAMADIHFLISKAERNGRTYTSVTPLQHDGRKQELARIIGGAVITETTLKSAEEMLLHLNHTAQ